MRLFLLFLTIFISSIAAFSQTAQPKSVFQSWNEVQLILPLVQGKDAKGKSLDKITATLSGITRIGRKSFDLLDDRASVTLDFHVAKHLNLFAGAVYRRDEIVKNVRNYETRFVTGAIISTIWKKFSFRDRNMLEHRFRNGRGDTNIYRQRIQITHPVIYKDKELFSPFISEEGYNDLAQHKWVQNEFLAGITRKINPHTAIDFAYLRNDSKPINVNGFSLSLRIKLR